MKFQGQQKLHSAACRHPSCGLDWMGNRPLSICRMTGVLFCCSLMSHLSFSGTACVFSILHHPVFQRGLALFPCSWRAVKQKNVPFPPQVYTTAPTTEACWFSPSPKPRVLESLPTQRAYFHPQQGDLRMQFPVCFHPWPPIGKLSGFICFKSELTP
jgi:hypothetical protein